MKSEVCYTNSLFISLKTLHATGTERRKEHVSETAWLISTPVSPRYLGSITTAGIKNNPLLAAATILARIVFLAVCESMFVNIITAMSGYVVSCQRNAEHPTAIT